MIKKLLCIVLAVILVMAFCAMTAYAAMAREQIVYRAATLTKAGDGRLGVYFAIAAKDDMDALGAASVTIERREKRGWVEEYIFTPENTSELQTGGRDYYDLILEYSPERGETEYRAVVNFVAKSPLAISSGAVTTAAVMTDPTDSAKEYTVVMKTALYDSPSDTGERITVVKAGTHVTKVSDVGDQWSKVEFDGAVGYIESSRIYLTSTCYKVDVMDSIEAPFFKTPEMNYALSYLRNGYYVVSSGYEDVNGLVESELVGISNYIEKTSVYRLGQIGYIPYSSLTES